MTSDILILLFTLKKSTQFFTINYNFKFFGELLYEVEEAFFSFSLLKASLLGIDSEFCQMLYLHS